MGQNSGENIGFGGKMLIMLYGLGLAVLGAQPLQKQYGSLRNFVNVQWKHISNSSEDLLGDVGIELSSKRAPGREVKTLAFPESKANTGEGWFSGLFGPPSRGGQEGRARLADPASAPNPVSDPSAPIDATARAKQKDLDRLSHTDRKELSKLIDDL